MSKGTPASILAVALLAALSGAARAAGAGMTITQHGGRGAAQAGALVARADDPSAVRYNPAGLAGLEGLRIQAGLDFQVVDVSYAAAGGGADALHEIQFPPALYLTWKPAPGSRWTLGGGIDSPLWSLLEWPESNEAARSALESEATLLEARAAAAWAAGGGWSLGGVVRWLRGSREQAIAGDYPFEPQPARLLERVDSTVEGAGVELAARWAGERWGAGLVWTGRVELDGEGDGAFEPLDAATAALPGLAEAYAPYAMRHEMELPETLTAGFWVAAGARTRLELDLELARWSAADGFRALAADGSELAPFTPPRHWRDTTSLRAAVEHRLDSGWRLGAGLGRQESPVPDSTRGFDFPHGDATVASLGASIDLERIGFDLGWSYHDGEEAAAGTALPERGTFRGDAQAFSISARWRLDRRATE